jgi:hypothetical protein
MSFRECIYIYKIFERQVVEFRVNVLLLPRDLLQPEIHPPQPLNYAHHTVL